MEAQDPLAQLADIHLPDVDSVNMWPPAIGWWILMGVFLALCFILGSYYLRYKRQQKYLSNAVAELQKAYKNIRNKSESKDNELKYLQEVNAILKRVALLHYGDIDESIASLSGRAWLDFLDSKTQNKRFTDGPGKVLSTGLYQKKPEFKPQAIYHLAMEWIRTQYKKHEIGSARKEKSPS